MREKQTTTRRGTNVSITLTADKDYYKVNCEVFKLKKNGEPRKRPSARFTIADNDLPYGTVIEPIFGAIRWQTIDYAIDKVNGMDI